MQRTTTKSKLNSIFIALPLLALLAGMLVGAWNEGLLPLPELSRRAVPAAHSGTSLDLQLEVLNPLPAPFHQAVMADGSISARVPTDSGMPPLPDCSSLGIECDEWDVQLRETTDGNNILDVSLKSQGRTVGKAQLMRVETAEFEQLHLLHQQGVRQAWIGHIQVAKAFRSAGLGRLMWQAGDAALKIVAGSGTARAIVDTVGWGQSLMRTVPTEWFIIKDPPVWAYVIQ